MRTPRLAAALAALLTILGADAGAQTTPTIPPPSLIAPTLVSGVPVFFQWTPVNPGNVYTFFLQSHARAPLQAGGLSVDYELQISDLPDVTSHVLVDVTTSTTIFSFPNQNISGEGFTNLQPPGIPLASGVYYWRVRALLGAAQTAFSSIGRFTLNTASGGGASTPFHDMAITALVLTAPAYVDAATVIVATIQNTGTFPERGVPLTITADGATLARITIPPTAAGQTVPVTAIWTPAHTGYAQITSVLDFAGQDPHRKIATASPYVREQPRYPTAMGGTLRTSDRGYVLVDASGRELALVVVGARTPLDLQPFLGRAVLVRGTLSKSATSFVLTADQIVLSRP